ncbi:MAG: hypothetical protein K2Q01_07950 [Rickettsiales bacterium]|nr:hypothetical protein [Rickettsiales bacterium]
MDWNALKESYPDIGGQMWFRVASSMNGETQGFIVVILLFALYFHIRFTPEVVYKAPSFLTTLGILGTFFGIAVGLLDFDPANVQKSVPMLIDGVKTAVWASACGVFCALTIKFRDIISGRKKTKRVVAATVDDLAESLKNIEAVLGGVEQALVGDTEPSLLLHMQAARVEQADTMARFGQALDSFCEQLADSNMKALVAALNEIISGFNVKLNEQFGDNFKQLNAATEKLLVWQEKYAEDMAHMVEQQGQNVALMATASDKYKTLVMQAENFTEVAHSMGALLAGLEAQRTQMQGSLEQLGKVLVAAGEGLPNMERQILEMSRQVLEGMRAANEEFNAQMRAMIEHTKAQVVTLDNALSEELTKSLESFGRQMASLSSKFAQDYGPITERLQQVLRIAS